MLFIKMLDFKENNCRLCKKVFCCVKCRKKHEEIAHNINHDCHICLYGEIIIKHPCLELLSHIKSHHWPLHCKRCKRLFRSIDELTSHKVCPGSNNLVGDVSNTTPLTPNIVLENVNNDSNYKSPPVMYPYGDINNEKAIILNANNFLSATTSTPMQGEQDKSFFENMSDPITPVEFIKKEIENNSYQSVTQSKESSSNFDRKVTFNEEAFTAENTPNIATYVKGCLKKRISKTPINKDTIYETALTDVTNELDVSQEVTSESHEENERYISRRIKRHKIVDGIPNTSDRDTQGNIWISMASVVKTLISKLSSINSYSTTEEIVEEESYFACRIRSKKRLRKDSESYQSSECLKKIKLTDIKCRRPINSTAPYKFVAAKQSVNIHNKSTQTDE